jgi:maltose alpha-D-glucosyltransferase/alpha-amylase
VPHDSSSPLMGETDETVAAAEMIRSPSVAASDVMLALSAGAAGWIAERRWFGSKSRTISGIVIDDLALDRIDDAVAGLALARLLYADGGEDQYFLPVMLTASPSTADHTIAALTDYRSLAIVDGPEEERFRGWLIDTLADGRTIEGVRGSFRFEPTEVLGDYLAAARSDGSRLIRSEQSNSSIIYGDAIIGKLFRRLQPGVNPDLEIGRFLTEHTGFRAAPALVGGVSYLDDDGETSVAVLQIFMPNAGDAWTATLTELRQLIARASAAPTADLPAALIDSTPAAVLGRRTAELHVALASSDSDEAFAPEPVTPQDIARWERETIASIERQAAMLDNALPRLTPLQQQAVVSVDLSPTRLASRIGGYRALEETVRIRVHGDYHLGQILRGLAGDIIILDFEGEPSRSIDDRRAKTAALKDVAGMLRSLRYARAAAVKAYDGEIDERIIDHWLAQWEAASRDALIDAYRRGVTASSQPLVPASDDDFTAGLLAWELDKALYELAYEANNRPAWLDVPLMTLAT